MKWWSGLIGLAPFALSAGLALTFALAYKALNRRMSRRSPLAGRKVGKLPGQELVERVSDHETDLLLAVMLMYMALPLMFLGWVGTRFRLDTVVWGSVETIFLLGALALFGYGLFGYVRAFRARERARDGLLAERVTGMQLNRLVAQGCTVMHDLPGEGFNIDHVVIAPRGVYAVETKSFRKPKQTGAGDAYRVVFDGALLRFPDFAEKNALEQARRQAQWLAKVLREALGRDVPVIPALALPGWLIEQGDDTWRNAAVKVFSPMGGGANFMAKDIQAIDATTRNLIRDALAVRYPDIPA
ncbi:nuclease-related domain-containing protein [Lysobacter solisilvae (ex Woo and Kim 2020)]|uniref:NERD domain-containing protein n=1 Tax=Agrilutibacter terrestris TaxID=2865112 RepID=A0A7H0FUF8_9GAMM|nr:nuclease-related domain-containing protein [Lysobacter terrestris]QNP39674.1 NERD domain-containing protein [Lysobacter terrestris]